MACLPGTVFHLKHDDQRGMFDVFSAHAAWRASLMFNTGPFHGGRKNGLLSRGPSLPRQFWTRQSSGSF